MEDGLDHHHYSDFAIKKGKIARYLLYYEISRTLKMMKMMALSLPVADNIDIG